MMLRTLKHLCTSQPSDWTKARALMLLVNRDQPQRVPRRYVRPTRMAFFGSIKMVSQKRLPPTQIRSKPALWLRCKSL